MEATIIKISNVKSYVEKAFAGY